MSDPLPDFEGFAKAVLDDWPGGDLDGGLLFDLSVDYGMIREVPGGYDPEKHIDAECICPDEGDPWYEYTWRGVAGPGLYSVVAMRKRSAKLEAENARLREALQKGVDLIAGDAVGYAWKLGCREFLAKARAALNGETK